MGEKRLNNSIFLMYIVSTNYMKDHNLTVKQFSLLDEKYSILNYIAECPDIFDNMTEDEMVKEIDEYIAG